MSSIVLATRNKGKIAELSVMLRDMGVEVLGLDAYPEIGEIEETGDTFEANALLKAEIVARTTRLIAVADDSGLEVDALDGAPGVYSARYSLGDPHIDQSLPQGERNNIKLLRELAHVPDEKRTARFVCVMCACSPTGQTFSARGQWEGIIAREPSGVSGFGYDPVFFDPELGMTAATMTKEQKNSRSHRGLALQALMAGWSDFLARAAT